MFKLVYTAQARRDYQKAKKSPLVVKIYDLLTILETDPLQNPPPFEQLIGDLNGAFSRRINRKHRIVYEILDNEEGLRDSSGVFYQGLVKILRTWTHYE